MKIAVAATERLDSRAMPQIPWPDVQPPPSGRSRRELPVTETIRVLLGRDGEPASSPLGTFGDYLDR